MRVRPATLSRSPRAVGTHAGGIEGWEACAGVWGGGVTSQEEMGGLGQLLVSWKPLAPYFLEADHLVSKVGRQRPCGNSEQEETWVQHTLGGLLLGRRV